MRLPKTAKKKIDLGVLVELPRLTILNCLLKTTVVPLFIEEIAKVTKVHPRMVSHHIDVLERGGFVKTDYVLRSIGTKRRKVSVRQVMPTKAGVDCLYVFTASWKSKVAKWRKTRGAPEMEVA